MNDARGPERAAANDRDQLAVDRGAVQIGVNGRIAFSSKPLAFTDAHSPDRANSYARSANVTGSIILPPTPNQTGYLTICHDVVIVASGLFGANIEIDVATRLGQVLDFRRIVLCHIICGLRCRARDRMLVVMDVLVASVVANTALILAALRAQRALGQFFLIVFKRAVNELPLSGMCTVAAERPRLGPSGYEGDAIA